jgi:hypothetical protein
MLRIAPVALAVGLVPAACSLLTNVPDLSGGGSADGSASGGGGGSGDGGDTAGFCAAIASSTAFCDDFDDREALLPRWDSVEPGGVEEIDAVAFRSPPHAFFSGPPARGPCKYSVVRKTFGPAYRASRLAFAVDVGVSPPSPVHPMTSQALEVSDVTCQVVFVPEPSAPVVLEQILTNGQIETASHALSTFGEAAWHDVVLDYDPDGDIIASVDGRRLLAEPARLACPAGRGPITVEVGWHCVDDAGPNLSVHVDNVTFDPR